MAYRIIFKDRSFRQYIIFDFIKKVTISTIDCTTEIGQHYFCSLFGFKKLFVLCRLYSTNLLILKASENIIIHKSHVDTLFQNLNERSKRMVAGFLLLTFPKLSKKNLSSICNLTNKTLMKGQKELLNGSMLSKGYIRASGGGRKSKIQGYDNFLSISTSLAEDHAAGDPMNSRRWVRKSLSYFQDELSKENIPVSCPTVRKYFKILKISLKVNKKSIPTEQFEHRDLQFKQISRIKKAFLKSGNPVISIDTKKKQQLGFFRFKEKLEKRSRFSL